MTALALSPAERRELRAQAHHLEPVVMIGAGGLTDAVVREVDAALNAHGLIKVRVLNEDRPAREGILQTLCDTLGAAPVQHIGKLLVLWRPIPPKDKPVADTRKPGPRIVKVVKFAKSGSHRPIVKKVKVLGNERLTPGGLVKRARARPSPSSAKKRSGG